MIYNTMNNKWGLKNTLILYLFIFGVLLLIQSGFLYLHLSDSHFSEGVGYLDLDFNRDRDIGRGVDIGRDDAGREGDDMPADVGDSNDKDVRKRIKKLEVLIQSPDLIMYTEQGEVDIQRSLESVSAAGDTTTVTDGDSTDSSTSDGDSSTSDSNKGGILEGWNRVKNAVEQGFRNISSILQPLLLHQSQPHQSQQSESHSQQSHSLLQQQSQSNPHSYSPYPTSNPHSDKEEEDIFKYVPPNNHIQHIHTLMNISNHDRLFFDPGSKSYRILKYGEIPTPGMMRIRDSEMEELPSMEGLDGALGEYINMSSMSSKSSSTGTKSEGSGTRVSRVIVVGIIAYWRKEYIFRTVYELLSKCTLKEREILKIYILDTFSFTSSGTDSSSDSDSSGSSSNEGERQMYTRFKSTFKSELHSGMISIISKSSRSTSMRKYKYMNRPLYMSPTDDSKVEKTIHRVGYIYDFIYLYQHIISTTKTQSQSDSSSSSIRILHLEEDTTVSERYMSRILYWLNTRQRETTSPTTNDKTTNDKTTTSQTNTDTNDRMNNEIYLFYKSYNSNHQSLADLSLLNQVFGTFFPLHILQSFLTYLKHQQHTTPLIYTLGEYFSKFCIQEQKQERVQENVKVVVYNPSLFNTFGVPRSIKEDADLYFPTIDDLEVVTPMPDLEPNNDEKLEELLTVDSSSSSGSTSGSDSSSSSKRKKRVVIGIPSGYRDREYVILTLKQIFWKFGMNISSPDIEVEFRVLLFLVDPICTAVGSSNSTNIMNIKTTDDIADNTGTTETSYRTSTNTTTSTQSTKEDQLCTTLNPRYNATFNTLLKSRLDKLKSIFKNEIHDGLLEILTTDRLYPQLRNVSGLRNLYGDSEERLFWRSKQCLDFGYLLKHVYEKYGITNTGESSHTGESSTDVESYYLQLEDDVLVADDYLLDLLWWVNRYFTPSKPTTTTPNTNTSKSTTTTKPTTYTKPFTTSNSKHKNWFQLSFYNNAALPDRALYPSSGFFGFIGQLYHLNQELGNMSQFFISRFDLDPIDWALIRYLNLGSASSGSKEGSFRRRVYARWPSLFEHVGRKSTLSGKEQLGRTYTFRGSNVFEILERPLTQSQLSQQSEIEIEKLEMEYDRNLYRTNKKKVNLYIQKTIREFWQSDYLFFQQLREVEQKRLVQQQQAYSQQLHQQQQQQGGQGQEVKIGEMVEGRDGRKRPTRVRVVYVTVGYNHTGGGGHT